MKFTKSLSLLLFIMISFTATVIVTESCKKNQECESIDCNVGSQNPETCKCECPTGFSGANCEIEDLCVTNNVNCQNGGTCVNGACDCPDGFLGANCQTVDLNKIQTILNGGTTPITLYNAGVPLDSLIGKQYGGGIIASLDTGTGVALIATAADQTNSVKWGGTGTDITAITDIATIPNASADFDGETKTAAIVAQLGNNGGADYAAKLCADLVEGGFDDWYLPAEGELNELFKNIGNAGTGQMPDGFYWSSTERSPTGAWYIGFANSAVSSISKDANYRCRCVRK